LILSLALAFLNWARTLSSPLPHIKFAVAEKRSGRAPRKKTAELDSQNRSQRAQEGPGAIAGGLQVPKEGKLPQQARNGICEERSKFNILHWRGGFRDQDGGRKESELPHRHDGVASCDVYEFDLQRSSGDAYPQLYMSLNFAVQRWQKNAHIRTCGSSLRPRAGSAILSGSGSADPSHQSELTSPMDSAKQEVWKNEAK
jgi:hypothetical protein